MSRHGSGRAFEGGQQKVLWLDARRLSGWLVSAALSHLPHRLLSLGVGRQELRRYGTPAQHDRAHGLDVPGLRRSIAPWLAT